MDVTVKDPLLGHLLDGRYRVDSRIARGGMASVYLALDTRLDRVVAVKVMHAGLAADQDFVARFIREAKSAARLSHPSIVAVHDQGTDESVAGGSVWLAMEYVEGRTLRDLMDERGPLSPREALELLEPALAALGAAHRAGIVHRDVKPENVLLAEDGRIKVADFGLARAVSSSTSHAATQGMLIGTVAYLSPEQVERGVADPRSDVYAAGILLFEMLTGAKPFEGETPIQVAFRHVHDTVPAPSTLMPALPAAVDELVLAATSRDPDGRPADATALLADLVAVRRTLPARVADAGGLARTLVVRDDRAGGPPPPGRLTTTPAAPTVPRSRQDPQLTEVVPRPTSGATAHHEAAPRPRRRRGLVLLLVLLLLAAGLGTAGWYVGVNARTTTPGVLSLSEPDAAAKLDAAGLSMRVAQTGRFDEKVPAGAVLATDPAPGEDIDKDGTVTATLSLGAERYDVPELANKPEDDAREALEKLKLVVADEPEERFDENADAGLVLETVPAAGAEVRPGTPVTLIVSKGREPIEVPGVVGTNVTEAAAALTGAGLKVEQKREYSEGVSKDDVISQDPDDGTLFRGDVVALAVSDGPPLVKVPNVSDDTREDAIRKLEQAGFRVKTRGTRILDRVFQQSGGKTAPKGSTITITTI